MLKVDKSIITDKKKGIQRKFTYKDVEYDCDQWADAKKYMPADFDLVYMKTKNKIFNGWAYVDSWDGAKISPEDEVLFWKHHE